MIEEEDGRISHLAAGRRFKIISDLFNDLSKNIQLGCGEDISMSIMNKRGARGVMVIVAGIGYGDTSSNPGLIAFHIALIPLGKV